LPTINVVSRPRSHFESFLFGCGPFSAHFLGSVDDESAAEAAVSALVLARSIYCGGRLVMNYVKGGFLVLESQIFSGSMFWFGWELGEFDGRVHVLVGLPCRSGLRRIVLIQCNVEA
jgi:hypothetical protein